MRHDSSQWEIWGPHSWGRPVTRSPAYHASSPWVAVWSGIGWGHGLRPVMPHMCKGAPPLACGTSVQSPLGGSASQVLSEWSQHVRVPTALIENTSGVLLVTGWWVYRLPCGLNHFPLGCLCAVGCWGRLDLHATSLGGLYASPWDSLLQQPCRLPSEQGYRDSVIKCN